LTANRRSRAGAALWAAATLAFSASEAAASQPSVKVFPGPDGASQVVQGQVDIAASPAVVWRVITDPALSAKMIVNMRSTRVLQQDPAGRWDVREQISKGGLLPGVRTVIRSEYTAPSRVSFRAVDGDIKQLDGEWRLSPLDGGRRTHVVYESRVTSPFPAPAPMVRSVLRGDMPKTLANLRDASEAEAARP
jgi:uncharacterized protein YndB with AHSA1/START domain